MPKIPTAKLDNYPELFRENCKELESLIGHSFNDPLILYKALTHSSYSNEKKTRCIYECNERLEFLGDSVLAIAVSEKLFSHFSDRP